MKYTYHKDGISPSDNEIFVFGSNLSGIHGGGAARAALDHYGAVFGNGRGIQGRSYAIPTKDYGIRRTLSISEISPFITEFKSYAANRLALNFFVTRVGCGLAGYRDSDIAPLFKGSSANCNFPEEWEKYLE